MGIPARRESDSTPRYCRLLRLVPREGCLQREGPGDRNRAVKSWLGLDIGYEVGLELVTPVFLLVKDPGWNPVVLDV